MKKKFSFKPFKSYLIESIKIYEYKIKFCFEPTPEQYKALLYYIQKYDPIDISEPKKSIVQMNPLDFPDIENTEIYIIELKTSLPVSSYVLQKEIKDWIGVPENFIIVRSKFDPLNIQSDIMNTKNELEYERKEKELKKDSLLSTDPQYTEYENQIKGEEYFSNKQVENLKQYLTAIRQKAKENFMRPSISSIHFELFNDKKDEGEYNKNIKDSPRTYHYLSNVDFDLNSHKQEFINIYDDFPFIKTDYIDKKGNKVTLSKKIGDNKK